MNESLITILKKHIMCTYKNRCPVSVAIRNRYIVQHACVVCNLPLLHVCKIKHTNAYSIYYRYNVQDSCTQKYKEHTCYRQFNRCCSTKERRAFYTNRSTEDKTDIKQISNIDNRPKF